MSPYNKRRGVARYLPIRKIVTVAVAAGLTWLARRAGMDLGSESANEAAVVVVGLAAGYAENDPRVREAAGALDVLLARVADQLEPKTGGNDDGCPCDSFKRPAA